MAEWLDKEIRVRLADMVLTDKNPITPMETNAVDEVQVVQKDPIGSNGAKGDSHSADKEKWNNKRGS